MALVLSIIHVLACLLIIGVILVQSGKGGGMGAGFGGASAAATQLFGGRGAGNFLTQSTVALAMIFMCTSLGLAYLSSRPNSLLDLSESSGREASDEDTIVEQGSGDLVEVDPQAAPTDGAPSQEIKLDQEQLQKMIQEQMAKQNGTTGTPDGTNGQPPVKFEVVPAPPAEETPEPAPEVKPTVEVKVEPKPKSKPKVEPKPEAKPEPKPEATPEAKPEAKPEPAEEPKPATKPPAEEPASEEPPASE